MATLAEIIFIFQLLGLILIVGMKLYNVMLVGSVFSNTTVWLTFIGGIFLYGLGMVTTIISYEEMIFIQLFLFERLLLLLGAILHFIEVLLIMSNATKANIQGQRRNSVQYYKDN